MEQNVVNKVNVFFISIAEVATHKSTSSSSWCFLQPMRKLLNQFTFLHLFESQMNQRYLFSHELCNTNKSHFCH
uniref:Uncharacterized protein n=1 Tax=Pararge aegeria TaxID=116150 RepID=S4PEX1_9NEOP